MQAPSWLFPLLMQGDNESIAPLWVLRTPYSASRGCFGELLDGIILLADCLPSCRYSFICANKLFVFGCECG